MFVDNQSTYSWLIVFPSPVKIQCYCTCSPQRAPWIVQILLQPLGTNVSEVVLLSGWESSVRVVLLFSDDCLLLWSDPRLCLKVKRQKVLAIVTQLIIAGHIICFSILFTAIHLLINMHTWKTETVQWTRAKLQHSLISIQTHQPIDSHWNRGSTVSPAVYWFSGN